MNKGKADDTYTVRGFSTKSLETKCKERNYFIEWLLSQLQKWTKLMFVPSGGNFFETVILFLGGDAVIMDGSLGGQTILQYENQWGFMGVSTILQQTFQPQQLIAVVLSHCDLQLSPLILWSLAVCVKSNLNYHQPKVLLNKTTFCILYPCPCRDIWFPMKFVFMQISQKIFSC